MAWFISLYLRIFNKLWFNTLALLNNLHLTSKGGRLLSDIRSIVVLIILVIVIDHEGLQGQPLKFGGYR